MIEFSPISASIGGAMIGLAAVLLLKFNGRIAGISGILNGAFAFDTSDRLWRVLFILGLIVGGAIYQQIDGNSLVTRQNFPIGYLALAGFLVGFGTRLGSGCTSGHGVCGIAQLSPRSIVATLIFLGTGMFTASTVYLLTQGAS